MELAARRFTRWVLILHVALFGIVLLIIGLSVRVLYSGAREQAIDQARHTQEVLARQTAIALQSHYESITGVLELLQPAESEAAAADSREILIQRLLEQGIFSRVGPAIWSSLSGKISLLFVVDPQRDDEIIKVLGAAENAPDPRQVVGQTRQWLAESHRVSISRFLDLPQGGAHVLCVPMRGPSGLLLVAVVPISAIEQSLLRAVKNAPSSSSVLIDEDAVIVFDPRREHIGRRVLDDPIDPHAAEMTRRYLPRGVGGSEIFQSSMPGDDPAEPAVSTIEFADVLGKRWALIITTPLSAVDGGLRPVFRDAMLWGGFIMLALTAILTSTAFQMIRSRIRLERIRHEMLTREMTQARQIQLAWLPHNDDDPPFIDMSAVNVPATHISGDFYNWFPLDGDRAAVVIGDVSGHGISAAFLMATTQLLVRSTLPRVLHDPGRCIDEVNRQLCQNNTNGQFVTMLILVIDVHNGHVEVATAGHPPPLLGQGQAFEPLAVPPQLVLGVDPDTRYETQRFDLPRGSAMLLYTDGVLDAQDLSGDRFGLERIVGSVFGHYDQAHAMIDAVLASVDAFRAGRELPDDLTLVAIQMQPAPTRRRPVLASNAG